MKTSFARHLLRALARRREVGRVMRELNSSSDRALHDLGITRGDIRAIAHGADRA